MTGCEGQDWADYQGTAPSTSGLAFAMVKATEGTGYVNPDHAAQVAHARAEGLVVGHYHFARPGSMAAQVAYFLAHAGAKADDILGFDWEDNGVSGADKDTWIKAAQKAAPHNRVILYCNKSFWTGLDTTNFAGDGLWIADPDAAKGKPGITAPWLIHQYSEAGGIDRDYCHLTAAQLRAWANLQEDDVALTAAEAKQLTQVASDTAALRANLLHIGSLTETDAKGNAVEHGAGYYLAHVHYDTIAILKALTGLSAPTLTDDQVTALATRVAGVPGFAAAFAKATADQLAQRLES